MHPPLPACGGNTKHYVPVIISPVVFTSHKGLVFGEPRTRQTENLQHSLFKDQHTIVCENVRIIYHFHFIYKIELSDPAVSKATIK